ncbi:prefoldin subunit 3 [Fusarium beomiforme]|uniref:Prefoldin subunit 3 n=1 Tax=Fusarium beomiforme TaxID=44412 RepID=A0A9P5AHI0_9HYPO|nr:prefoldin subunit 3 [Fusarium beomiforme]
MLRSATRELRQKWQLSQYVTVQTKFVACLNSLNACRYASSFDPIGAAMAKGRRTFDLRKRESNKPQRKFRFSEFNEIETFGRMERRLNLFKGWVEQSPAVLLRKYLALEHPSRETLLEIAAIRTMRLPVVLIQMHLRLQVEADPENNQDLAQALPDQSQWEALMKTLEYSGNTEERLNGYMEILFAKNDEERSRLFLADMSPKPVFMLNYLLRLGSSINEVSTLDRFLDYIQDRLRATTDKARKMRWNRGRASSKMERFTTEDFMVIMKRLSFHCRRIEPRRLIVLADMMAEFIFHYKRGSAEQTYWMRCQFFNAGLDAIARNSGSGPQHSSIPHAYIWEAQRALLRMSGSLPETLLVDRGGFRAIQAVLSGMPKNKDEIHTATRYSKSWPPYLQPADGMDEAMEEEESWSRVVRAGMMMQEAGFPQDEADSALNILLGLAPNGTPTIQQQVKVDPGQDLSVWAASITATRNAREAWKQFKHPPKADIAPGSAEYAAMFRRSFARDVDPDQGSLPGDNSLSYPTNEDMNLTELEKLRQQPPSTKELFEMMRLDGVLPDKHLLHILVANAQSLEEAHRYLRDASIDQKNYANLLAPEPTAAMLKTIPLPLFSAYVDQLSKTATPKARNLLRAIRLVELRLDRRNQNWVPHIWLPIMKNLGQHHYGMKLTLQAQLRLVIYLVDRIDAMQCMTLFLFNRFVKTLRNILRRELVALADAIKANNTNLNSLTALYYRTGEEDSAEAEATTEAGSNSTLFLFRALISRMKGFYRTLIVQEQERQRPEAEETTDLSFIDIMRGRRDPVLAPFAHDLMLALAFAGEFKEMAQFMRWLIREWSPLLQSQDEWMNMEQWPSDVDMLETLCVYRAYGEPMITDEEREQVRNDRNEFGIWEWPGDDLVRGWIESSKIQGHEELNQVLSWVRIRQYLRKNSQLADVDDLGLDAVETKRETQKQQLGTQKQSKRKTAWPSGEQGSVLTTSNFDDLLKEL